MGSFPWYPQKVTPLLGSHETGCFNRFTPHTIPLPHLALHPPSCEVPLGPSRVWLPWPPTSFNTQQFCLFPAGFANYSI